MLTATAGFAEPTTTPPDFRQVYQLLRSNLDGVTSSNLDRAAVKGLLDELPGQAMLVNGSSKSASAPAKSDPLSKAVIFDGSYVYFRVTSVEGHLADKLRSAYQDLSQTNKSRIKGVVLDLRFAGGSDYPAAAAVADCFLDSEQPLLDWGAGSASATKKTNAITVPLAILVNSQTTGAAEALAAVLREADTGLILGETTAGQANIFKDFPLNNGEKLRIAAAQIKLGDGTVLNHGVKPDIMVDEPLADERAYQDDPYKNLHPPPAPKNDTNSTVSETSQTPHRVLNEAELVREKRAGETPDGEDDSDDKADQPAANATPAPPVVADATLARALDLLKGLAVMQESRPG